MAIQNIGYRLSRRSRLIFRRLFDFGSPFGQWRICVGCRAGGAGATVDIEAPKSFLTSEVLSGKRRVLVHSGCYFCSNLNLKSLIFPAS